jgi:hypothetical protein
VTDLRFEDAPPLAASTMNSLRGVGYAPGAALADLVDNSISAGANRVDLQFVADGADSYVTLLDNGCGMSGQELSYAMRIGCKNPLETRGAHDLGRFGMGLKTASLSQCRKFSVASRSQGHPVALRCWDLDRVEASNRWQLLCENPSLPAGVLEGLERQEQGTQVIWQDCDGLGARDKLDPEKFRRAFFRLVEGVEQHLRLFFHRFLEADLVLTLNGRRLKPWDPFMRSHAATTSYPRQRIEGDCYFQGFVLPHKDRLTPQEFEFGGGRDGWTAHQGFYIYRNERLLVAGSWLGLGDDRRWTKDESYRLARICLDISNSLDAEWNIDIKKSTAKPPERLRSKLTPLAEVIRGDARRVFAHRGSYGNSRSRVPVRCPIWHSTLRGDHHVYRLNREHPLLDSVRKALPGGSNLEPLLRFIEETVPVQKIWLDVAEAGELSPEPFQASKGEEVNSVLIALFTALTVHEGYSAEEARHRLLGTEPFHLYPELVNQLVPGGTHHGS